MNIHYGDILIKFGEIININNDFLPFIKKENLLKKYKSSLLDNGDIVIADAAEDLSVGKCSEIIGISSEKILAGLHTIPCRPKLKFAPRYLGYYMNSDSYHNQLLPIIQGTKVSSISKTSIKNTLIKCPIKTEEQNKIGKLFNKIDSLIVLHQRKLEKLGNIKKSMLEKMFPKDENKVPEIRFKGFNDDWEQHKLEEYIYELKSGLSRMLSSDDIGLPVVRANNIENNKLDMENDVKYWYKNDPQGADTSNYLIKKYDILVNFINSESKMGTATIVEDEPIRDTIYTTNILRMRTNEKCDNYFFLAQTNNKKYKDYIKGISKIAVNQASFTTGDFKNFDISTPKIEEQNKIGLLFKRLDSLIALHQRKLEKLKNIKKACLEKMFV